jgi:hypothetical protein
MFNEACLVVAKYNEDISWIKNTNIPYIIYNKGEYDNNYVNIPNEGREGETYLRFILEYYNTLPNYIILSQGNPFMHCYNFTNIINNYNYSQPDSILGLSDHIETEIPDKEGYFFQEGKGVINTLPLLGIKWEPEPISFYTGAQYIVSKSYILNKSKIWWENCYEVYNNNPRSPWIFERIWYFIFNIEYK